MNQDDKIPKFFCLVCEKELRSLAWGITPLCCIENGGVLDISMGYGSNYDQEILWEPVGGYDSIPLITEETKWKRVDYAINSENKLRNLLACNKIRGCICDECLKKKYHLLKGYWVDGDKVEEVT